MKQYDYVKIPTDWRGFIGILKAQDLAAVISNLLFYGVTGLVVPMEEYPKEVQTVYLELIGAQEAFEFQEKDEI